ncbi:BQ2448_3475 [Microbotryum intermedium]|uniref:BQ2448_3475 protein n=1 Tax=Microbotryum intermedium TaxID=269621 RepID=A0A238FFD0_9BASI|nr:BQ2448_3475 [Microbotryum intermedium]
MTTKKRSSTPGGRASRLFSRSSGADSEPPPPLPLPPPSSSKGERSTIRVEPTSATAIRPDLLRRSTSPTDSISYTRSSPREPIPPVPPMMPISMRLVTTIPASPNPNPFAEALSESGHSATADDAKSDSAASAPGTPEHAVISFARRPSSIDPLSTTSAAGLSQRELVSNKGVPSTLGKRASGGAAAAAGAANEVRRSLQIKDKDNPVFAEEGLHQRRRSHTRHPSISLAPPASGSAPASRDEGIRGTRAPVEAFGSVEMLQGQRQHQNRTRGSEVFNSSGMCEGRASLGEPAGRTGLRRQDPTEGARSQRQGFGWRQSSLTGLGSGASDFPPMEAAIVDIANQLRAVDSARRESEWQHRLSGELSSENDTEIGSSPNDSTNIIITPEFGIDPSFQFPSFKPVKPFLRTATSKLAYEPSDGTTTDLGELGPGFSEESVFNEAYSSKVLFQTKSAGWSDESLGSGDKEMDTKRHSIVALPVYPSAVGTNSRSFKTRVKKIAGATTWLTVLLSTISTWIYLAQRLRLIRMVETDFSSAFVSGWGFLAYETCIAVILTVSSFWTVYTYRSPASLPKLRLRGDINLPSVDVLIVSSGQPDRIVFDCAIAAAAMDYPAHRYRVMVLDSANSPTLQRELQRHVKTQACPHLSYHRPVFTASDKGVFRTRAEAVAFGLKEASTFGAKGPAEFVAVLEADVIPDRNYLRASLPTIVADSEIGLIKASHGFINLSRRVLQSVLTLLQAAETSSEHRSGFVMRRSAMTEIGGFPAKSWVPDGELEAMMWGNGYKVETVNEVLQWTMAQPTYGEQINAMMINAIGPLRTALKLNFFLYSSKIKSMSLSNRLYFLGRALVPFFSLLLMLLISLYPFMLSYGGVLVITPDIVQLTSLLESALVMIVLSRLHEVVWCWATGTPSPRRSLQAWIFAAPYHGLALFRLILPKAMGGFSSASDVTIPQTEEVVARPSFFKRLFWFIIDPHLGYLAALLAAFGVSLWRIFKNYQIDAAADRRPQAILALVLTLAWPSLVWLDFFFASLVPFTTLLFPCVLLTTPREAFVVRDHYSFAARPKQDFKTMAPWKQHRGPEVLTGIILILWSAVTVFLAKATNVLA